MQTGQRIDKRKPAHLFFRVKPFPLVANCNDCLHLVSEGNGGAQHAHWNDGPVDAGKVRFPFFVFGKVGKFKPWKESTDSTSRKIVLVETGQALNAAICRYDDIVLRYE
ncbi:hypothetical protein YK56LOC_36500 [Caballeronia sp. HLA56]